MLMTDLCQVKPKAIGLTCICSLMQDMDDERERALKGLNTTLAWLQEGIVISGVLANAFVRCKCF